MLLESSRDLPRSTPGVFALASTCWHQLVSLAPADAAAALQQLAREFDLLVLEREDLLISEEEFPSEWDGLVETIGAHVDATLSVLIQQTLATEEFYSRFWAYLSSGFPCTSDAQRHFALWWTLMDPRLPYFHLDPAREIDLDGDDLVEGWVRLGEPYHKLRFAIQCGSLQNSRLASHLADLLDGIADRDSRVLLLAAMISEIQDSLDLE